MKKIQGKHETHMLTYAITNDGNLVNVDEVQAGQDCNCVCPACKEPLIAKNNGSIRVHHFAHRSGSECNYAYESMLHLLAKERVQNAFLNAQDFYLDFEYRAYCPKHHECKYIRFDYCYTRERKRFNLKEYYDRCEQEVVYDGINRRSDLKLFSSTSPQRSPIYIEFCVTHASEQEKLHSGNRIIECIREDESDINKIVTNGFIEDKQRDEEKHQTSESKIQIYGFTNTDYHNNNLNMEIEFSRYVLYKSGKTRCYQDHCNCKELRRSERSSLYEVSFHTPVSFGIYEYAKYLGYDKFHIPNCLLCRHYVESYNGIGRICRLYKYLQISRDGNFDTSRAKACPRYAFNQEEHDKQLRNGIGTPFDEI